MVLDGEKPAFQRATPLQKQAPSLIIDAMLRRLLAKYQTVKVLLAWHNSDIAGCLTHLNKAEQLHPLKVFETAFKAQVLLHVGRQAEADQLCEEVIARIDEARNLDERYIQIWCILWRQTHFRDLPDSNALWAEAGSLPCSNYLRRFLLLRRPPELALSR